MEIPKFSPEDYQEAFARVLGNGSIEGVESYIPQIAGVRQDRDRAKIKEDLERAERQLRSYGFFNVEYGDDGRPVMNRNINHKPALLRELQDTLEKVARENRIRVLCPFVDELTAADNVGYAIGCVGEENVLAIKAGVGDHDRGMQAIDRIQNVGGEVVYQLDVLEHVNWQKLRRLFGIYSPKQLDESTKAYKKKVKKEIREPFSGSKGLTMLAGILELHRRDKIARQQRQKGESFNSHDILEDDTWIVFHDTDITNPEEYRALEHLAFVLAHESEHPNIFRAAQIARGGAGRNNEAVMNAANYLANMRKEYSRLLGITLQSLMWPLTGERMMRWGELKQMNWSNRMGIETWWNVLNASVDIRDVSRRVAQVANPNQKEEEAESYTERELSMIYMLGMMLLDIGNFSDEIELYPHEWGVKQMRWFNRGYGGKPVRLTTYDNIIMNDVHAPMKDSHKVYDYLLPSIAMMEKLGLLKF